MSGKQDTELTESLMDMYLYYLSIIAFSCLPIQKTTIYPPPKKDIIGITTGLFLCFEAAVTNEDSPVTSHKTFKCHL